MALPPMTQPGVPLGTGLVNAIRGMLSKATSRMPKAPALEDPKDPKATIETSDLAETPKNPPEDQRLVRDYIYKEYRRAKARRLGDEWRWQLYRHHMAGRQWYEISKRGLVDPRTEEQIRSSVFVNLLRPLIEKVVALATEADPDVLVAPLMPTNQDRQAAEEAKGILGHESREVDDSLQRQEHAWHALVGACSYRYLRWNPNKLALVPLIINGQAQAAFAAPVGGIEDEVLPADNVLIDPSARRLEDASWIIVDRVKPLDWIQTTFGRNADGSTNQAVFAIQQDGVADGLNQLVPGLLNGNNLFSRDDNGRPYATQGAHVLEWWQKPNPKYPEGRYIICAGQQILHNGPWPYEKKDIFPVAPMCFGEDYGNPYGISLVQILLPLQLTINREWTRITRWADKTGKLVVLREQLDNAGHDPYKQREAMKSMWREQDDYIEIMHRSGTKPPTPTTMPQPNQLHFELIDRAYKYMQEISGAVDVLRGETPPGVTAGVTVNVLQQAAASQFKPFIRSISHAAKIVAEWRIALYAQFVAEPRMMGMDNTGTPQDTEALPEARYGISMIQALTNGGQTAVLLSDSSAVVQSESSRRQELIDEYQSGRLGPPGSPQSLRLYWEHVNSPLTISVLKMLDEQDAMAQANALKAEAEQQAQLQAEQQAQQQQQVAQATQVRQQLGQTLLQHALKEREAQSGAVRQHQLERMKMIPSLMTSLRKPTPTRRK